MDVFAMCMNEQCYKSGRCDFCDARCPYYTTLDSLEKAMELLCIDKERFTTLAHDLAIHAINSMGSD